MTCKKNQYVTHAQRSNIEYHFLPFMHTINKLINLHMLANYVHASQTLLTQIKWGQKKEKKSYFLNNKNVEPLRNRIILRSRS